MHHGKKEMQITSVISCFEKISIEHNFCSDDVFSMPCLVVNIF